MIEYLYFILGLIMVGFSLYTLEDIIRFIFKVFLDKIKNRREK